MNIARHHTDQSDSRETLESLEQKLAAVPLRSSIQLTSAEARARAVVAAHVSHRQPDGVGVIAAILLLVVFALGVAFGAVVAFVVMGGLS